MPIIELTDKHRKRLATYIAYFGDKYPFDFICERCNIIKGNVEYDTDLIVGFANGELCFENKKDDIFHGYPDGLTLQDWLNKVETLYQSNIKIDTADGNNIWVHVDSDGNILDFTHFNWVGSFNS